MACRSPASGAPLIVSSRGRVLDLESGLVGGLKERGERKWGSGGTVHRLASRGLPRWVRASQPAILTVLDENSPPVVASIYPIFSCAAQYLVAQSMSFASGAAGAKLIGGPSMSLRQHQNPTSTFAALSPFPFPTPVLTAICSPTSILEVVADHEMWI